MTEVTIDQMRPMPGMIFVEVENVEETTSEEGIVIPGVWEGGKRLQGSVHQGKVVKVGKGVAQYRDEKDKLKKIDAEDVAKVGDEIIWPMHCQLEIISVQKKPYMIVHAKNVLCKVHPN